MVPILGRLSPRDHISILYAFTFFLLERLIRLVLFPVLYWLPKPPAKAKDAHDGGVPDFTRLAARLGLDVEEHYPVTEDGYVLCLHRLVPTNLREQSAAHITDTLSSRPTVLLWHGFMMSSEVFICSPKGNLATMLLDAGYDVWLGNTRGNRYSCRHMRLERSNMEFWRFGLEELARYDLPGAVNYVLKVTEQPSLAYVGFSQGTAQAFAALSLSKELNRKIHLFVALAPATRPPGLESSRIGALLRASPQLLYLLLGRGRALALAAFWRDTLSPAHYVSVLDKAMHFLFGWTLRNISLSTKLRTYPHLYSYASVRLVVHWFQIIRAGRFQAYDEDAGRWVGSAGYIPQRFWTKGIQTPVAVLHGSQDALSHISALREDLPKGGVVYDYQVPEYEHLDFLWADSAEVEVYPHVLRLVHAYNPRLDGSGLADHVKCVEGRRDGLVRRFLERERAASSLTVVDAESVNDTAGKSDMGSDKESWVQA